MERKTNSDASFGEEGAKKNKWRVTSVGDQRDAGDKDVQVKTHRYTQVDILTVGQSHRASKRRRDNTRSLE